MRRACINRGTTAIERQRRRVRALWSDQRGVTAIIVALVATVLIGFTGLAVDVTYWETAQRAVQGASDQAALAATDKLEKLDSSLGYATKLSIIQKEAYAVAARNGYVNGQNGVTVTVTWPYNTTDYQKVAVQIQTPLPTFFSNLFVH